MSARPPVKRRSRRSRKRRAAGFVLAAGVVRAAGATSSAGMNLDEVVSASFGDGSEVLSQQSNMVRTIIQAQPGPLVEFFGTNGWVRPIRAVTAGEPLYVQLEAAACRLDIIEKRRALVKSASGDVESLVLTETAVGSNVFRSQPLASAGPGTPIVANDGTLVVQAGGALTAVAFDCDGKPIDAPATALVDPAGTIFDSDSNRPVAGTSVTLLDSAGRLAKVYGYDGVTAAPSTVVTGTDGHFTFPLVAAGHYHYRVEPTPGFGAPSQVAIAALPAGHAIDPSGSYGGSFAVDVSGPVLFDFPVDPVAVAGLFVEETASKPEAEIGDFVDFRITVRNASPAVLEHVVVHGTPAAGFLLQADSVRIAGQKVAVTGRRDVALGTLAPGSEAVITFRARLAPAAARGDGIDHVQATAGLTHSNPASVRVRISDTGVLSTRGYLIGQVRACAPGGDPVGVPDVRVVLEDGTSAVTDAAGKYSFYGLIPTTHVAKLDRTTLPDGAEPEVVDHRNAGDGASRFVDLTSGELARGDFALSCAPGVLDAIVARRERSARTDELTGAARALLLANPVLVSDSRQLPASGDLDARGVVGRTGMQPLPTVPVVPAAGPAAAAAPTPAPAGAGLVAPLVDRLATLSPGLGFVDLQDGEVMRARRVTINAKGPAALALTLEVNGQAVDAKQVGEHSVLPERDIAATSFIGVDLKPGPNQLRLVGRDPFGNVRASTSLTAIAPGDVARFQLDAPETTSADGHSIAHVRIRALDADGQPVSERLAVTVFTSRGTILNADQDPHAAGVQTAIENGALDLELQAPGEAGRAELRVEADKIHGETAVTFAPDLRPLMAVGLVDGVLDLRRLSGSAVQPTSSGDQFEREITSFSRRAGDASAATRAALYLKGKVLGETLLTLAYDSDKRDERLLRDIQPDQFYPVYGDASTRSFDAQSTGRLYVRVDRGSSYVFYGDFSTQANESAAAGTTARPLTQYSRILTGARGHLEEGAVSADAFASDAASRQVIDELRGNGTSGPYALSHGDVLANSEQIHILTRDRNQPALVISDVPLERFTDYEMEPLTGRILMKRPVPTVDANFNPVSLRVTYEVDSGGDRFLVAGVDAHLKVTETTTVGGTFIRDADPTNRMALKGVNGSYRFSKEAVVTGEVAESDADLTGRGRGHYVEFRQDSQDVQARVYSGRTDGSFVNPSAVLSQGRAELGGKVGLRITDRDRVDLQWINTMDTATGGRREGALATVEHRFDAVKVEVGARQADETSTPAQPTSGTTPDHFVSLRAKLTAPVPLVPDATAFIEYERAVTGDTSRQIAAIGGDALLPWGGRLYARHEFISSLSGAYDLNSSQRMHTTVIGIDSEYAKDAHVFNEYRVGEGIDGRSAEAAIGLRNLWTIVPGVGVSTTIENIKPVSGITTDRSNAATAAVDYTADPRWKGSMRVEARRASSSDSSLFTTGAAYRLSDDATVLGKILWSSIGTAGTAYAADSVHRVGRAQLGAAYRPSGGALDLLARVEVKRELDTTAASPLDETALIGSAHANLRPTDVLTFSGRYAIKVASDRAAGIVSRGTTQLVGGRAIFDVTSKWDVGVNAYGMFASGGAKSAALGAEAGYLVATNLWLSAGVNAVGFRERDLSADEYTQRGVYVRMRFKFDEALFARADGKR